jgi:hypothetical protein
MTWGIQRDWSGFVAREIVKETEKQVRYVHPSWGETRTDKTKFLTWRGDEDATRALCSKLTNAEAEYKRRTKAASDWYAARKDEIFASADTRPKGGDSTKIEAPFTSGAVAKPDAPKPSPSPSECQ